MRWSGRLAGVATVVALLVPVGFVAPATAVTTVVERATIPGTGNITLAGRGYGHGIGMSQYGARAAASQGVGYQTILDFYYPGTGRATIANTGLRVLLMADTDDDVRFVASSGMTATDGNGATRALAISGASVSQWRIVRTSAGMAAYGLVSGTWRAAGSAMRAPVTVSATAGTIRLIRPDGTQREYRGSLRAIDDGASPNLRTVNVVSMESYLRSVVPAESPASWPADALRAQSVAARTYAAQDRARSSTRAWDTCDTTACQVYEGYRSYSSSGALQSTNEQASTNAAITATANQIRTYGGAPAFTQFSSSNGGWTAPGSQPYLVAKRDPWDAVGNPVHAWRVSLTTAAIHAAYPAVGTPRALTVTRRSGVGEWSGRVESVTVSGTSGSATVTGAQFRTAFGLRSAWWKVTGSARLDSDFTADGRSDLLARRPDGRLMVYESDGAGGFASGPRDIGGGWQAMQFVERGADLTGDGNPDIVAVDGSGYLYVYRTNGSGGVGTRTRVGGGWGAMRHIAVPGDLTRDGMADLVAIDPAGRLLLYAGRGDGTFTIRGGVSNNWQAMTALLGAGDLDGDGIADLLARHADGRLLLYAGNGSGGVREARLLGRNWQDMAYLTVSGDWSGDGSQDILAARTDGVLHLYTWTGGGNVNPGVPISSNWQTYDLVR
ncbi:SpoIID/LytB domain-containing protein [Cellulosimicrobium cellulans]|uniref:SpoIID/LytB domain-containing protein n=1 Tax=Cellulosimicrobium cellulans TaxID=1710 RepID=UPI0036687376